MRAGTLRASSRRSTSAAFKPEMGKSRAFNSAFKSTTRRLGTSSAVTMISISRCLTATVCRLNTDSADQDIKAAASLKAKSTDAHTPAKRQAQEHDQLNGLVVARASLRSGCWAVCSIARAGAASTAATFSTALVCCAADAVLGCPFMHTQQAVPYCLSSRLRTSAAASSGKTKVKGLRCPLRMCKQVCACGWCSSDVLEGHNVAQSRQLGCVAVAGLAAPQ
jgi:hypothetical protein